MLSLLLPFLVFPVIICNPLQLDLPSSIAPSRNSTFNATRLTTHNECFDASHDHDIPATKLHCERALDTLVKGKSLLELHHFGYNKNPRVTDQLPIKAEYGNCVITLLTFDFDTNIIMTYAEIYAELLGPDGVLKECLGPDIPTAKALGGQTAIGPRNLLIADVSGQLSKDTDKKSW